MTKSNGFRKFGVIGVGLKVVFVCMIGIISVHGIKTYAANNSDTYFSFSFERGGTNETSRRYKDDTSAAYTINTDNQHHHANHQIRKSFLFTAVFHCPT